MAVIGNELTGKFQTLICTYLATIRTLLQLKIFDCNLQSSDIFRLCMFQEVLIDRMNHFSHRQHTSKLLQFHCWALCKSVHSYHTDDVIVGKVERHPAGRSHPGNTPISKSYRRADTIYLYDIIITIATAPIIFRPAFSCFSQPEGWPRPGCPSGRMIYRFADTVRLLVPPGRMEKPLIYPIRTSRRCGRSGRGPRSASGSPSAPL